MIDFLNAKSIVTAKGEISSIVRGAEILWQKPNAKYKCELEYLEGTGTQYINIGVVFKNTDECYLEAAVLTTNGDKFSIAPSVWNDNSNRFAMAGRLSNVFCAAYGSSSTSYSKYTPETAIDSDKHIFTYKDKVFAIEDLGATYDATNVFWGGDTTELRLFYGYSNPTHCRIYAYKQTRDGKAIVDIIPVLDLNDVPCMYDKVSGELFYNKGTGEFAFGELPRLPLEYQEVEYLESTGTQYIDTGYVMTADDLSFEGQMMWTKNNGLANFFFGYRSVTSATLNGDMRTFFVYGAEPVGRLAIRYGVNGDNSTAVITQNAKHKVTFDGSTLKVDDVKFATLSRAYNPAQYKTMWLFHCNATGYYSADIVPYVGRIYNFKMWQGTNLVRDFIPCYRKSDKKPGMYDLVTETFFTNVGTGEFLYQ